MPPIDGLQLAQRLDVVRQQQGAATHARGGECGLGAGMAAADDNHVEIMGEQHGGSGWGHGSGVGCCKRRA
jgi:hypothetical protein